MYHTENIKIDWHLATHESVVSGKGHVRGIQLADLGKNELHFAPVCRAELTLDGVAFDVQSLELGHTLYTQVFFQNGDILDFVIIGLL